MARLFLSTEPRRPVARFRVKQDRETELQGLLYELDSENRPNRKFWWRVARGDYLNGQTILDTLFIERLEQVKDVNGKPFRFHTFLGTYFESEYTVQQRQEELYHKLYDEALSLDRSLIEHPELYPYGFLNRAASPEDDIFNLLQMVGQHAAGFHLKVVNHKNDLRPKHYDLLMLMLEDVYDRCPAIRQLYEERPYLASLLREMQNFKKRRKAGKV